MPAFDSEYAPEKPLRILSAMVGKDGVPHALLFTGIEGVGKLETARRFAMALNCRRGPVTADSPPSTVTACGNCRSCKKIRSDSHPDIISIKPAGAFIRIDTIRELCRTLSLKPYEASVRVVIISDAQAMNPPAGNALLKVLEEPPQRTIFLLTADGTSGLLPTIVSRCQHIRFSPLPAETLAARLTEECGMEATDAAILSAIANGSVSRALTLHRSGWIQRRSWLLNQLKHLPELPLGSLLAMAARLAKNRETLERFLEIIYTWTRDLAVCRVAPQQTICRDVLNDLQAAAGRHPTAAILACADMVQDAMRDLRANANPRLTAEVLLLRLADCGRMPYDTWG